MADFQGKPQEIISWLFTQDREKIFEIKEHKEKRSLNANAYAWSLISKIADTVRASKDEIYLAMLKRYGQSEIVTVLSHINVNGYFKYYKPIKTVKLMVNGVEKEFTHYFVYKGSSEYDTKEMAILIDGIISEAEQLGIPTLTPNEVERIKASWTNI